VRGFATLTLAFGATGGTGFGADFAVVFARDAGTFFTMTQTPGMKYAMHARTDRDDTSGECSALMCSDVNFEEYARA